MVRVRLMGGKYHKEAFDKMDENSKITLVRETTNKVSETAIMVLSNTDHVGYVGKDGGIKHVGNEELIERVNDVEKCKVVLDKKYKNIAYMEVIEMNEYSFEIQKMTDEQIRDIGRNATLSVLSDEAKWCDLAFGGMRHQLAHQEGVKPKVGEICHLERKWRGKGGVNEAHREPGDKGTVHLVSNETGYSYGILMQSEKKTQQLKNLGVKMIWTNQEVRDYDYFLNPYTLYEVIQVIDGVFCFVKRVGPTEAELAFGRGLEKYEEQY